MLHRTAYQSRTRLVSASGADEAQRKVLEFTRLPEGWHFGHGKPPDWSTVVGAMVMLTHLRESGFAKRDVFPGEDGSILAVGYSGDYCIEVYCKPDGSFTVAFEENDSETDSIEGINVPQAQSAISQRADQWGITSGSYTRSILTANVGDTEARRSRMGLMEEYQLLTVNAYNLTPTLESALIFNDTMHPAPRVIRRSSGELTPI